MAHIWQNSIDWIRTVGRDERLEFIKHIMTGITSVEELKAINNMTEHRVKRIKSNQNTNQMLTTGCPVSTATASAVSRTVRPVNQLISENENLMRKIESQEQEFRVTNNTLKSEISSLLTINDRLEKELKLMQNNAYVESQPECDLGVNVGVITDDNSQLTQEVTDNNNCETIQMPNNRNPEQHNNYSQLSFSILAEKESLELKVNELQEMLDNMRKENELISAQVEELQTRSDIENLLAKYEAKIKKFKANTVL